MIASFFTRSGKYEVQDNSLFLNGECVARGEVLIKTLVFGLPAHFLLTDHSSHTPSEYKTECVLGVLAHYEVYKGESNPTKDLYQVSWSNEQYVINAINYCHAIGLAPLLFGQHTFNVRQLGVVKSEAEQDIG